MYLGIPHPQKVTPRDGFLALDDLLLLYLPANAEALDLAAAQLIQQEMARFSGRTVPISKAWTPPCSHGVIALGSSQALAKTLGITLPQVPEDEEGYTLEIAPGQVILCADTARGRLWAAQTFRQLLRQYGDTLPALHICDSPAMRYRGVMLDLARRKVPELDTLKQFVDTLSLLKLNMLQLQVEHTFQWRRHPHIGAGCGSLSCEDILALDAHCRERGVELVPMLQSFGHMRNILMQDEYRHLSENERLQWSLNPTDPATLRFMDELYEEYLPCFTSTLVNIGSDETVDLGRKDGKSNAEIARLGQGRVYFNRILALHELLTEKYGKRVMMWGDVVLHHPEMIPDLPKDLLLLNWHYNPDKDFPQVKPFAEHGIPQIVCPGTNSWGRIFPSVNWAWDNIDHFVRDGKAVGALGMLNTDWGDGGHFNLLGCSYYSFAQGAEVSWTPEPLPRAEFERLLAPVLFGPDCEALVAAIHALGGGEYHSEAWDTGSMSSVMVFKSPFEGDGRFDDKLRNAPLLAEATRDTQAARIFEQAMTRSLEPDAVADLAWAARALAYGKDKTAWMFEVEKLAGGEGNADSLLATGAELLAVYAEVVDGFCRRWAAENRRSEIDLALEQFAHGAQGLQVVIEWLQAHQGEFAPGKQLAPPVVPGYVFPWKENISSIWWVEEWEKLS